jgi:adenylate cyclase
MPDKPGFAAASTTPPAELFFRQDEGGRSYFRAYRPLINLPKCTVCHGSDHTVRGVIDIRSDITDETRGQTLILAGAGTGFFAIVGLLALVIGAFLRRVVIGPVQAIGKVCTSVAGGRFEGRVETRSHDEIGDLARTVNTMVEGLEERFKLTKYVSAGTLGALKAGEEPKRVERTLLFTDVRGFTSYTEGHRPERVVEVLNSLLDRQAEIIHANGGDIDKFVGDEIVSYFQDEDAAARACRAAIAIARLCAARKTENDGLCVGIGIASGPVILGMVGSARRADFTVIGDPVNVAARLCSLAKTGQIVVDGGAKAQAGPGFVFRGPYGAMLKGKKESRQVFILETGLPPADGGQQPAPKGFEA